MLRKIAPLLLTALLALTSCGSDRTTGLTPSSSEALSKAELLSQKLLVSAYGQMNPSDHLLELSQLNTENLRIQLNTDAKRLTFWINVYNAFIQFELRADTSLYSDRDAFFRNRNKKVAGQTLSFSDIEHGILRRNKELYSLGYFNKMNRSQASRDFAVERVDWRIHFALNCGAKSCPPVAYYRSDRLNEQLNMATYNYLKKEIDLTKGKPEIPKLFLWFRADFGGRKGITKILQKFGGLEESAAKSWKYKPYDWSIDLDKWYAPGELVNP